MKNKKLNYLIKEANKIKSENIAKELYKAPLPKNKKIQFRAFKLYFALLDRRSLFDILGVAFFSVFAFFAMIGYNESVYYLYFQVITVFGAIFFIMKAFLIKPIIHIVKYLFYKNWIKNIKIKVLGWEQVYDNDEILSENNWYEECSVFVKLDSSCPLVTKTLIDAAFVIFIENTKWVQYNFSSDTNNWVVNENKLVGSANSWVLGCLYRFIKDDLNEINKVYGGIESVEIKSNGKMNYVSRAKVNSE